MTLFYSKNSSMSLPLNMMDPTESNDISQGYLLGTEWFNQVTGNLFLCIDNSIGAAVWVRVSTQSLLVQVDTQGQTVFMLSSTPTAPHSVVMFVNGIEYISDNFTVSDNQVTWLNHDFELSPGDELNFRFR